MTDLQDLLDRAAGAPAPLDPHPDLQRGRLALGRTRRRRTAAGLAGVAAAGVLGVSLTRGGDERTATPVATDPSTAAEPTEPTESPTPGPTQPTTDPSAPVTGDAAPTFFEIPAVPDGWVLQGSSPYGVTLARPGDTTVPEDFEGKVVLMFEANPPHGTRETYDGRTVWADRSQDSGYTSVSVRPREGEPQGMLVLQFPSGEITVAEALAFVTGVRVRDGAVPVSG